MYFSGSASNALGQFGQQKYTFSPLYSTDCSGLMSLPLTGHLVCFVKPFLIAAGLNASFSFSSSLASLNLARHFSQQKATWVVPVSALASLFSGLPVSGQATSTSCA